MGNPLAASTIVEKVQGIIERNNMPLTVKDTGTNNHIVIQFNEPVAVKGVVAEQPRTGIEFTKLGDAIPWPRKDAPAERDYRWKMVAKYNSWRTRDRLQTKEGKFSWTTVESDIVEWWAGLQYDLERKMNEAKGLAKAGSVTNHPDVQDALRQAKGKVNIGTYGELTTIHAGGKLGASIEFGFKGDEYTVARAVLAINTAAAFVDVIRSEA